MFFFIFIVIVVLFVKVCYCMCMILDIWDLWLELLKGVGVFNYWLILWVFIKVEKFFYIKVDSIIVNSQGFIKFIIEQYGILCSKILFMFNVVCSDEIVLKVSG